MTNSQPKLVQNNSCMARFKKKKKEGEIKDFVPSFREGIMSQSLMIPQDDKHPTWS